jgi:hypothetical protein
MRRRLIPPLALLLLGQGGLPRAHCDFSAGVAGLGEAERLAARPIASLGEGRALGEALAAAVEALPPRFEGCGCAQLGELLREAAQTAGPAASEASAARITGVLEQVRFRLRLARQALGAQGCR